MKYVRNDYILVGTRVDGDVTVPSRATFYENVSETGMAANRPALRMTLPQTVDSLIKKGKVSIRMSNALVFGVPKPDGVEFQDSFR